MKRITKIDSLNWSNSNRISKGISQQLISN